MIAGAEKRSRYSDWLRAGRFRDRIQVGAKFSAPVQSGPGAHPASCTMGTGSFPGVKSGRGVTLTPHSLLVPWSRKGRAVTLLPLWAVRPVQSLSACTRVHFTFFLLWSWRAQRIQNKRIRENTEIFLPFSPNKESSEIRSSASKLTAPFYLPHSLLFVAQRTITVSANHVIFYRNKEGKMRPISVRLPRDYPWYHRVVFLAGFFYILTSYSALKNVISNEDWILM